MKNCSLRNNLYWTNNFISQITLTKYYVGIIIASNFLTDYKYYPIVSSGAAKGVTSKHMFPLGFWPAVSKTCTHQTDQDENNNLIEQTKFKYYQNIYINKLVYLYLCKFLPL